MSVEPSIDWKAQALWQALEPLLPGVSVEVVAEVESSNTTLVERVRHAGGRRRQDTLPMLLVAEHQARGRGRMGRVWHGARGASLMMSLALAYRPRDWSGLSLAVGCALADALDPPTGAAPRIGLKWPNDLWLMDGDLAGPGRKLGGILIETVAAGTQRMCVVGVGLNVLPLDTEALEIGAGPAGGLSHGLASLSELGADVSVVETLHAVAVPLARALRAFEQSSFLAFQADFARRDLLTGRTVTTSLPALPQGVACGVDARGTLQVTGPDGQVHSVGSGEIQLRLAQDVASA